MFSEFLAGLLASITELVQGSILDVISQFIEQIFSGLGG